MTSYETPPGVPPYTVPNSNMAIVSLVAGILGLTFIPFIGSIVAVITGSMAKKEIQQSAGALGGEGMATAGQILGWVGIALGVIGLCAGGFLILVPLCLGWFALSTNSYGLLFPTLLALL